MHFREKHRHTRAVTIEDTVDWIEHVSSNYLLCDHKVTIIIQSSKNDLAGGLRAAENRDDECIIPLTEVRVECQ